MQPAKRPRCELDLTREGGSTPILPDLTDPFENEEDWDDDDIQQLVTKDVPSSSQMSQVIRACEAQQRQSHSSDDEVNNFLSQLETGGTTSSKSFTFKKPVMPSASRGSTMMLSKPAAYSNVLDQQVNNLTQPHSAAFSSNSVDDSNMTLTASQQNSDISRKQLALEGEIKWLRNSLKEKDKALNEVRTSLKEETNKQKKQNSDLTTQHQKQLDLLKAQLQFKDGELKSVSQSLDQVRQELMVQKKKLPKMKLNSDGFPDTENWGKTLLTKSTNTDPASQGGVLPPAAAISVPNGRQELAQLSAIRTMPNSQQLIDDIIKEELVANLIATDLSGALISVHCHEEASVIKAVISSISLGSIQASARLLPVISNILEKSCPTYSDAAIERAIITLRHVLSACDASVQQTVKKCNSCSQHMNDDSNKCIKLPGNLIRHIKGQHLSSYNRHVVHSIQTNCIVCIRKLITKNLLLLSPQREELIESICGCMREHNSIEMVKPALQLVSDVLDMGFSAHCKDSCLLSELCTLCDETSFPLQCKTLILKCIYHYLVKFDIMRDHTEDLCEHFSTVAPSLLRLLSHLLQKEQESKHQTVLDATLSVLQMATHILNLLANSKLTSFASYCTNNHTEIQYCMSVLSRIYREKEDKHHTAMLMSMCEVGRLSITDLISDNH